MTRGYDILLITETRISDKLAEEYINNLRQISYLNLDSGAYKGCGVMINNTTTQ